MIINIVNVIMIDKRIKNIYIHIDKIYIIFVTNHNDNKYCECNYDR